MPPAMRFGVPLKEQDKPVELTDELLQKRLGNEFYVRYLESIGASPTPANMALARRTLPITSCKFTTAWKLRGWSSDCVFITPETKPPTGAGARHAAALLPHGGSLHDLQAKLLAVPTATADEFGAPTIAAVAAWQAASSDDEAEHATHFGAPFGPMSFTDAQKRFLYPFKAEVGASGGVHSRSPPARRGKSAGGPSSSAETHGSGDSAALGQPPDAQRFASRDTLRYERYTPEEIAEELDAPLAIHTKDIVSLQAEFVHSFPLEKFRVRLSESEMRIALAELSCKRTTRFVGLLALLLYWTHVAPLTAGREVHHNQLSALYCAVQHYFSNTREKLKARRGTLLFVLPALLMLVRVAIEALFRQAFPKWWTTIEGKETLGAMDDSIERTLDPSSYLSHISPLESTTAAIRIAARGSKGIKSNGQRSRWFATSALVSSALPTSRMVRRQASATTGGTASASGRIEPLPAVASSLPADARQQLFNAALHRAEEAAARRNARPEHAERHARPTQPILSQALSLKELVRPKAKPAADDAAASPARGGSRNRPPAPLGGACHVRDVVQMQKPLVGAGACACVRLAHQC